NWFLIGGLVWLVGVIATFIFLIRVNNLDKSTGPLVWVETAGCSLVWPFVWLFIGSLFLRK
ncbi:MAG: hypothetical protein NTX52_05235, partial [Planctomycetota bacterium]|nr:hypothetical protein [Planctomycetota bacterium]